LDFPRTLLGVSVFQIFVARIFLSIGPSFMDPGKTVVKRGQVIQSIVQHSAFDAFFGVVVIANAFYIGKEQKIGGGNDMNECCGNGDEEIFSRHVTETLERK